eukprot:jgi/Galph1/3908/GphlegSOOS_G2547.1
MELGQKWKQLFLQSRVWNNEQIVAASAVTFICLLLVLIVWVLYVRRHYAPPRTKVLITGRTGEGESPGSGKTTLYFLLRTGKVPKFPPVTSMEPNEGTFIPCGSTNLKEMTFVDFPGSLKFKTDLEEQVRFAKCIIYILDVCHIRLTPRDDAIAIHDLLKLLSIQSRDAIPILIFCNKVDLDENVQVTNIQNLLAEEILKYQRERASLPDGQSVFLVENPNVLWSSKNYKVTFKCGSALKGQIEPVLEFLTTV